MEYHKQVDDLLDCKKHCDEDSGCNWYTYDTSNQGCTLTHDCADIDDDDCEDCYIFQAPCEDPQIPVESGEREV